MDNNELQQWLLEIFDVDTVHVTDDTVTITTTRPGLRITPEVKEILKGKTVHININVENIGPDDHVIGVFMDSI